MLEAVGVVQEEVLETLRFRHQVVVEEVVRVVPVLGMEPLAILEQVEVAGGGGDSAPKDGGAGGSGIVIVRYSDALGQRAGGGTVTTPSGYIVHTFTGDGTFATNANFGGTTTFSIN
jgi:hypothetical protein